MDPRRAVSSSQVVSSINSNVKPFIFFRSKWTTMRKHRDSMLADKTIKIRAALGQSAVRGSPVAHTLTPRDKLDLQMITCLGASAILGKKVAHWWIRLVKLDPKTTTFLGASAIRGKKAVHWWIRRDKTVDLLSADKQDQTNVNQALADADEL